MPQLHTYLPEAIAAKLKQRAQAREMSLSKYLAEIVLKELGDDWPDDFFDDVAGGWQGEPLERPAQGELEERDEL